MNLRILALDFDGTIAVNGELDRHAAEAIQEARAAGLMVVLVTGRILSELDARLPERSFFDAIVAENGAVLWLPAQPSPILLTRGPDPLFLAELERRGVQHHCGSCVVEAEAGASTEVLDAIRGLSIPLGISFNRNRLMVLPLGVTKGTGLQDVLWRLRASSHNAIGIGDAENDHPLLEACEFGAAVAWGSETLQGVADAVIPGHDPGAIAPYIRGLLPTRRISLALSRRRWIRLGTRDDGEPVDLALRGRNVLIGGDPKSGKSWITGLLCEQLILQRYSVCILDPEGDYGCLEALPGVIVVPIDSEDASLSGVERALGKSDLSIVVDMSAADQGTKQALVRRVLQLVNHERRQSGLPHRIVIDEAHYFLGRLDDPELFDRDSGGYVLVTYRTADLSVDVLNATDAVIVTQVADQRQALTLRGLAPQVGTTAEWLHSLASLEVDEALLLPGAQESGERLLRFRIAPRATAHVRHRQKYCDIPVAPGRDFVFTRNGQATGQHARTLADLMSLLPDVSDDVLRGHLTRGDLHRWVERVFGDTDLADAIRGVEGLEPAPAREAMRRAISDRYGEASA